VCVCVFLEGGGRCCSVFRRCVSSDPLPLATDRNVRCPYLDTIHCYTYALEHIRSHWCNARTPLNKNNNNNINYDNRLNTE